jgi:hypothetical protein
MDAMEVMEMVFDKTFYFNAKVVKFIEKNGRADNTD